MSAQRKWITEGFDAFSKGTFENGGQNLYVSKKGILQRIFQFDINQDGHPDLLFANSQSMYERPPVYIYQDALRDKEPLQLPTHGIYDGLFADLHGSGYDDLVVASHGNGTHGDAPSLIFFGGPDGLSENYRMELYAPRSTAVCAGDFNGDGKQELLFVSNGSLRMFFQKSAGFNPADFVDIDIPAKFAAAADFDGDGFCDVCIKDTDGKVTVLFGGPDGLDKERSVSLEIAGKVEQIVETSSTAGMGVSATEWKPCSVVLSGKQYLFTARPDAVVLFACTKDRKFEEAIVLPCENAVGACASDLTGNGVEDLAVAVFTGRDDPADCRIYTGDADGWKADRCLTVPVTGAVSATPVRLDGNKVIFCRTGGSHHVETPSPIVGINARGEPEIAAEVMGGDCSRIAAGRPTGGDGNDQIAALNHMLNRKLGHENIYIYLGGKDGYLPERRLELPGHSAVDGEMVDFFDTGKVDILVVNCFEDAVFMDDGSYIYTNDGKNGFDPERKVTIPTVRAHGTAIGDFRKSGYLDIAFGGFFNRELRIFHGSEKGYSLDNCTRIVFGPDTENYVPPRKPASADWDATEEEKMLIGEYGQLRWLLAADFNNDGWLDLFVSEILGPRCYILWGGPEGFSKDRMTTLQTDGVGYAAAVDLSGNGYLDLLLAQHMSTKKPSKYESYITVYWGGPEGFQENRRMQLPATCANSVTVGDYNGNGLLDIYATAYQNGRERDIWSHLYKNDNGKFSIRNVQYLFNHSGCGCVSGDFNGDGYTDLAVAGHKEYGNHCSHSFIFWGGPDGLSDERKTILPTIGPHGMSTVDPGNIRDRGPRERYTSEICQAPADSIVKRIAWEGECTSTSWVEVEMRSARSAEDLETVPWQRVDDMEDLSELRLAGFVQYRLALCANCACGTPRIRKVTVEFA